MNVSRVYAILFAIVLAVTSLVIVVMRPTRPHLSRIAVASSHRGPYNHAAVSMRGGTFVIDPEKPDDTGYHNAPFPDARPMSWSPDGEWIIFQTALVGNRSTLFIARADGADRRSLVNNNDLNLWPTWSPDGGWIAFVSIHDFQTDLYRIRPDGSQQERIARGVHQHSVPRWSPDSRWLAVSLKPQSNWDIYRIRSDGSHSERLTDQPDFDGNPVWSPDGRSLAYIAKSGSTYHLYQMRPDGTGKRELALLYHPSENAFSWSPDGRWIVFESDYGNIYRVRYDGSHLQQLTATPSRDMYPAWSPDGQWIIFLSFRNAGGSTLYKMHADGSEMQAIMDDPVAAAPIWSPTLNTAPLVGRLAILSLSVLICWGAIKMRNPYSMDDGAISIPQH